ncbi:MAG: carboxypeptidase-like regulatory domain-containing protein [Planctomycetota bacterium]
MGRQEKITRRRIGLVVVGVAALVGLGILGSSPGRRLSAENIDRAVSTGPSDAASEGVELAASRASTAVGRVADGTAVEPLSTAAPVNERPSTSVLRTDLYGTLQPPPGAGDLGYVRIEGWSVRLDLVDDRGEPTMVQGPVTWDGRIWQARAIRPGPWILIAYAGGPGTGRLFGVSDPVIASRGVRTGPIPIVLQRYGIDVHVSAVHGASAQQARIPLVLRAAKHPADDGVQLSPASSSDDLVSIRDRWLARHWARSGWGGFGGGGGSGVDGWFGPTIRAGRPKRLPAFRPGRWAVTVGHAEHGAWAPKTQVVELTLDRPVARLDFVPRRKPRLSLRVARTDGGPLDRVEVRVHPIDGESPAIREYADESGRLEVTGIAPGECFVYARARLGRGRYLSRFDRIDLGEDETRNLEIVVEPGPTVIGRLVDARGTVVADSQVSLVGRDDDRIVHHASTDAGGRFELVGLYGREYVFRVAERALAAPRAVAVRAGADTIDVGDVVLAP